ncbi:hypothetical protein, partial [Burkholderia cenocepacia]|uniref:hypothetical protein n=1 Tax=Burkholderia cenocepacia TaxID=95486 RepID=UPI00351C42F0
MLLLAESRRGRFSDIVFAPQAVLTEADEPAPLAPTDLEAALARAGFADVVRHVEQALDLDGTPTFVVARNPASTSATQRGSDASDLDTLARSEQWLV